MKCSNEATFLNKHLRKHYNECSCQIVVSSFAKNTKCNYACRLTTPIAYSKLFYIFHFPFSIFYFIQYLLSKHFIRIFRLSTYSYETSFCVGGCCYIHGRTTLLSNYYFISFTLSSINLFCLVYYILF